VVEDRRTGRLPAGSEITSSYLHAVRAGYPVEANPLTEQTLAAALAFLARRGQGATVDIRA